MNQKNRITYRFDRKGQSIPENKPTSDNQQQIDLNTADSHAKDNSNAINNNPNNAIKQNVIPLYPVKEQNIISDVNPWNSPFQEDISALEQLIRNTDSIKTDPIKTNSIKTNEFPPKETAAMEEPYSIPTDLNKKKGPLIQIEDHKWSKEERFKIDYLPNADPTLNHAYEIEDEYGEESPKNRYQPMRRKTSARGGASWFNVFLSVTGALATGALFGYLLLSLFTGASIFPSGSKDKPDSLPVIGGAITNNNGSGTNANGNGKGETVQSDDVNNGKEEPNPNSPTVALTGLNQTYYFLQFGVFSNKEGRDAAVAQLAEKGLAAAALNSTKDYRVYAGMGSDRSKAQALKALLPDIDLYIKEVSIAAPAKLPYNGDVKDAQAFFEETGELVQMLDELTLAQLEGPALSALSDAAATAWGEKYQKWTEKAATVRIGVEASGKDQLDKLVQSINAAAKSMQDYDKNPSSAHLWKTQSKLMESIVIQKNWFESISAL